MEHTDKANAELQKYFWEEYNEYISCTPMTTYERRLLRRWVGECHSVYHDPGSKYLCDPYPPRTFLEAYREDREITLAIRNMTQEQKTAYLKDYMSYED